IRAALLAEDPLDALHRAVTEVDDERGAEGLQVPRDRPEVLVLAVIGAVVSTGPVDGHARPAALAASGDAASRRQLRTTRVDGRSTRGTRAVRAHRRGREEPVARLAPGHAPHWTTRAVHAVAGRPASQPLRRRTRSLIGVGPRSKASRIR